MVKYLVEKYSEYHKKNLQMPVFHEAHLQPFLDDGWKIVSKDKPEVERDIVDAPDAPMKPIGIVETAESVEETVASEPRMPELPTELEATMEPTEPAEPADTMDPIVPSPDLKKSISEMNRQELMEIARSLGMNPPANISNDRLRIGIKSNPKYSG